MARTRRGGAWRAISAAVLVMGLSAGPLVGASSAATLDSFSGKGNGYALGISVDLSSLPASVKAPIGAAYTQIRNALPAQAKAALPAQFNFIVDQKLIETLAQMGPSQKAQSVIGSGTVDLGKLLGGASGAESTTIGTSHVVTKTLNLPTDTLPLVDVAAGVLDTAVAAGPKVSSTGTLTQVAASLASLKALFPAELNAAFDQLVTAVDGVIDTANTSVGSQLNSVATTLTTTTDPVVGGLLNQAGLGSVATDASQLTTALTNSLKLPHISDVLSGNVAAIRNLHNVANSTKLSSGKVTSDASTNLANINVLGLLNVDAVDLASHSEAAGTPGSAMNSSRCKIADVKLGGANGVALDGKHLYVNGAALPTPLANIGTIQNAINGVTSSLGLSVTLCDAAQRDASVDGTAAAQRVSAIRVVFAPKAPADIAALGIKAGDPLVKIVIDPTVETSVAARIAAPVASNPKLPRTGAGALVSILVGLGLAGTAIFLRRKFA